MQRRSGDWTKEGMQRVQSEARGPEQLWQVAWQGEQKTASLTKVFVGQAETQVPVAETNLSAAQAMQSSADGPVQSAQLWSQMRQVSASTS